jgi:type II secretory pathway pseudopilin PulG
MSPRRTCGGWILLETIVAMAVLSIGVVAVNRAIGEALVTRALARDYTEAWLLLEQKLAEAEMQPVLVADTRDKGGFGDAYPRFTWFWDVKAVEVPSPSLPEGVASLIGQRFEPPVRYLGRLAVTVRWTRKGNTYERALETIIPPERFFMPGEGPGMLGEDDG